MRKKYLRTTTPKVAQEGISEGIGISGRVLSLEEEIVVLQEAGNVLAEVQSGVEEACRGEDISDGLLDIADTVSDIECLTPQQAALIDTATEMAVSGTAVDPDEILPSMEAYIGLSLLTAKIGNKVAVEDFKDTARQIWESIRKFITELAMKAKEIFVGLFSVLPRQLVRVKAARETLAAKRKENSSAKPKATQLSMVVGTLPVSYPSHMVNKTAELTRGLADLTKLSTYVFSEYPKSVKKQGDIVAAELKKFDPTKAGDSLASVRKQLAANNFLDFPKNPATGYMGCFKINPQRVDLKKCEGLSDTMVLNTLRHTRIEIVTTVGHNQSGTASIMNRMFDTMSFSDMDSTLKAIESLIQSIMRYENGSDIKAMEATRHSMIDGGNAAQASMNKLNRGSDNSSEVVYAYDVMKSLMNFNTTYVGWVNNLPGEFTKRLIGAIRSSMILVEKSLAQY